MIWHTHPELAALAIICVPLLFAIAWFSLLVLAIRFLGPIIGQVIQAQLDQFAATNPNWGGTTKQGLEVMLATGKRVVAEVAERPRPPDLTDEEWDNVRLKAGAAELAYRLLDLGISTTSQMVRRVTEDALTAWQLEEGKKS